MRWLISMKGDGSSFEPASYPHKIYTKTRIDFALTLA